MYLYGSATLWLLLLLLSMSLKVRHVIVTALHSENCNVHNLQLCCLLASNRETCWHTVASMYYYYTGQLIQVFIKHYDTLLVLLPLIKIMFMILFTTFHFIVSSCKVFVVLFIRPRPHIGIISFISQVLQNLHSDIDMWFHTHIYEDD